uniref:Uncharacterized protein n=1 Tax=Glossina palpalis gambiensis TaxID=67801 RepID=A0A1B0AZV6_9MUSC
MEMKYFALQLRIVTPAKLSQRKLIHDEVRRGCFSSLIPDFNYLHCRVNENFVTLYALLCTVCASIAFNRLITKQRDRAVQISCREIADSFDKTLSKNPKQRDRAVQISCREIADSFDKTLSKNPKQRDRTV